MIPTIESNFLIREIATSGHNPMKFLCSDGEAYYVKYRSANTFKINEINCLFFEVVCSSLLNALEIQTLEIAFVYIKEGSYDKQELRLNKRYIKPGIIGFGSREIKNSDLLKKIEFTDNRREFNKLLNPEDLIRIAIFDLWVGNVDRYEDNFNLLTQQNEIENKLQIIPIDHAFTFGGSTAINTFSSLDGINMHRKIIDSQYFKAIISYINKEKRLKIITDFVTLVKSVDCMQIIGDTFNNLPKSWGIDDRMKLRVIEYLNDQNRLVTINQVAIKKICS